MGSMSLVFQSLHAMPEEGKAFIRDISAHLPKVKETASCDISPTGLDVSLWEMDGKDVTFWTGDSYSLCIMEDDYPNTLPFLHTMQIRVQRTAWTVFLKTVIPEQVFLCTGASGQLEKMMYHGIWDLSLLPDTWVLICLLLLFFFNSSPILINLGVTDIKDLCHVTGY